MKDETKLDTKSDISRIAAFVAEQIYELRNVRSQRDIAEIAGYTNQNMITMIKQGRTKVAIDRVTALAKALDTDPSKLMRLALEQFYEPSTIRDIEEALAA